MCYNAGLPYVDFMRAVVSSVTFSFGPPAQAQSLARSENIISAGWVEE